MSRDLTADEFRAMILSAISSMAQLYGPSVKVWGDYTEDERQAIERDRRLQIVFDALPTHRWRIVVPPRYHDLIGGALADELGPLFGEGRELDLEVIRDSLGVALLVLRGDHAEQADAVGGWKPVD